MSISAFNLKEYPPKEAELLTALGPTIDLWNQLSQWMHESLSAQQDLKYMYGKKYGWARRFSMGNALLSAFYPRQDGFTVQIILNRAALEQASRSKLGKSARQAIDRAHLYAEGKWLFIPVESKCDAEDVRHLLQLKMECTNRRSSKRPAVSEAGS